MAGEPGRRGEPRGGTSPAAGLAEDRSRDGDRGATATEYAILTAFIAVVIALAIGFFGQNLDDFIQSVASSVGAAF